jgi:hypothetical protein
MSRYASSIDDDERSLAPKIAESICERLKRQGLERNGFRGNDLQGKNLNAEAAKGVGADGLIGIRLLFDGESGVWVLAVDTRVGWTVTGVKKCELRRMGEVGCL